MKVPSKERIIIQVKSGCAYVYHNPSDHEIEIRDYDIMEKPLLEDKDGNMYHRQICVYEGE